MGTQIIGNSQHSEYNIHIRFLKQEYVKLVPCIYKFPSQIRLTYLLKCKDYKHLP